MSKIATATRTASTGADTTAQGEQWVSAPIAARHFGISARSVQRMVSEGRVPVLKIGRSIRVRVSDIERAAELIPACN